jgi:hypothetical protein
MRYRTALANARKAAQNVTDALDRSLGDIRGFVAHARASLLAEQVAAMLRQRLAGAAHGQFRQDYEQLMDRAAGPEEALEPKVQQALATVIRSHRVDDWMQRMVLAWNAANPTRPTARLRFARDPAAMDLPVAETVIGSEPLTFPSSYASAEFGAIAVPLMATPASGPDAEREG